MTTVLLSFLSSIIAAFIVHNLTVTRMKKDTLSKFQIQAYSDFLEFSAKLAVSRRLGETSSTELDLVSLNNAKNRIITSGDFEVVEALTKFWEQGGTLEREQEILTYTRLINIMREKLGHVKHDLFELNISNTIFKLEPSSYSYKAKNAAKK